MRPIVVGILGFTLGGLVTAILALESLRPFTADPRIVKHAGTEITSVEKPTLTTKDSKLALNVAGYVGKKRLELHTFGGDTEPDYLPAVPTKPLDSEFVFYAAAGAIFVARKTDPYNFARIPLHDGAIVHVVTNVDLANVYTLGTDTLFLLETEALKGNATAGDGPPKRRLWTVETSSLDKLIPPPSKTIGLSVFAPQGRLQTYVALLIGVAVGVAAMALRPRNHS